MDWRREPGQRPEWLAQDNSVPLLVPVTYHQGEEQVRVDRLQLRRLTAKERRIMDAPGLHTDKVLEILAGMTALPMVALERLDSVDLDRVDDALGFFMEPGSVISPT